jgi:hypothetical protein
LLAGAACDDAGPVKSATRGQERRPRLGAGANGEVELAGSARWWDRWSPRLLVAPGRRAAALRYDLELALHDGVATGLSALALELDLAAMSTKDPVLGARIDDARGTVFRVVDDLRRLSGTIYPPVLRGGGLGPALRAVAERRDLRLSLDLPRHDLCEEAWTRTGLLVADHMHTLSAGTAVRVRVRGRRLVRVLITERSPGWSKRRNRAVLRCA